MTSKLIDITGAEAEAKKELQEEAMRVAKGKIKASLQKISMAADVLTNAEREHEVLLRTIAG